MIAATRTWQKNDAKQSPSLELVNIVVASVQFHEDTCRGFLRDQHHTCNAKPLQRCTPHPPARLRGTTARLETPEPLFLALTTATHWTHNADRKLR